MRRGQAASAAPAAAPQSVVVLPPPVHPPAVVAQLPDPPPPAQAPAAQPAMPDWLQPLLLSQQAQQAQIATALQAMAQAIQALQPAHGPAAAAAAAAQPAHPPPPQQPAVVLPIRHPPQAADGGLPEPHLPAYGVHPQQQVPHIHNQYNNSAVSYYLNTLQGSLAPTAPGQQYPSLEQLFAATNRDHKPYKSNEEFKEALDAQEQHVLTGLVGNADQAECAAILSIVRHIRKTRDYVDKFSPKLTWEYHRKVVKASQHDPPYYDCLQTARLSHRRISKYSRPTTPLPGSTHTSARRPLGRPLRQRQPTSGAVRPSASARTRSVNCTQPAITLPASARHSWTSGQPLTTSDSDSPPR